MQVKHLDHVNLSVRNFVETADWYERVFGFRVVEQGVRMGTTWGVLKSGEAMLCVYEDAERAFWDGDRLKAKRIHGVNHLALRVTDPKAWEATLLRERLPLSYGDGPIDYPNSRSWYVVDPTGYEIEVVAWKGDSVAFT